MPPGRVLPSRLYAIVDADVATQCRLARARPRRRVPRRQASGCSRCGPSTPRRATCSRGPRPLPGWPARRGSSSTIASTSPWWPAPGTSTSARTTCPSPRPGRCSASEAVIGLSTHTPDAGRCGVRAAPRLRRGRTGVRHADEGRRGTQPSGSRCVRQAHATAAGGRRCRWWPSAGSRSTRRPTSSRPVRRRWRSSRICCTAASPGARARAYVERLSRV